MNNQLFFIKILLVIYLLGALISCAYNKKREVPVPANTGDTLSEIFVLTTGQQQAVFFIATGWVGGEGTMPVIDLPTGNPKEWNGKNIYFDPLYEKTVDKKLPVCVSGTPVIKITATIQLVEQTARIHLDEGNEKSISYYEAKVISLGDIWIKAAPCF